MGGVLITGATGFIGSRLIQKLSGSHNVVALSRGETRGDWSAVRGSFASWDDLQALNVYEFDTAVHLASEIGGCSEEAGLSVNVLGTSTLLRYLLERGCKRWVLASSVAAVGCLSEAFLPRQLPISDDHPCDAVDAYGLSKALMEDVAAYFHRQNSDLDVTLFRIGAVLAEDFPADGGWWLEGTRTPFVVGGGLIAIGDVIDAFVLALEQRKGPGIRRLNLVSPVARTLIPVPEALHRALGEPALTLDTGYFVAEGREVASLYSIKRLWDMYGFCPSIDVRTMTPLSGTRRGTPFEWSEPSAKQ